MGRGRTRRPESTPAIQGAIAVLTLLLFPISIASPDEDGGCPRDMVLMPGGSFTMGSVRGEVNESPPHTVTLSPFCIDLHETTNRDYSSCVRMGRCRENLRFHGYTEPLQPVVGVSWQDAQDYCRFAGKRLPTEAEWERAARGKGDLPISRRTGCGEANYGNGISMECEGKNPGRPVTVGSYPANDSGLHDILGNVWEWVHDIYDAEYYRYSPGRNPQGPEREVAAGGEGPLFRVVRGGSCFSPSSRLTPTYRTGEEETVRAYSIGFRCASFLKNER